MRIPEQISVRISQVRCSLSWKAQAAMQNPPHNPQPSQIHMDVWGGWKRGIFIEKGPFFTETGPSWDFQKQTPPLRGPFAVKKRPLFDENALKLTRSVSKGAF